MRSIIFFVLLLSSMCVFAQSPKGSGEVIADDKIRMLVNEHIALNEKHNGISGFRIQIYFDSGNQSKIRASRVRAEFSGRFPSVNSYLFYDEPYYKVRIGDFRSRIDANRFLKVISGEYPSAFIVVDRIGFPPIE